jgi:hypothetical protein
MAARRLRLMVVASLCGLACVLAACVVPGVAGAATQFGSFGEEAEQMTTPTGVAVDASGDVYVGDQNRVDKWDGGGNWLLAWGEGVLNKAGEMQVCTSACFTGRQVGSPEALELNTGVAVDNDPLSSSYGDVYVVDEGHTRVEKFGASGNFILMFGGHVNENGEDICRAGEACKLYAATGSEDGEFSYMPAYGFNGFISVGRAGDVYVGDNGRVEVFEASGAWKENISLAGLSTEARPTALAVDTAGDVFLKDAGVAGVHEFEPNGTEKSTKFDELSTSVTALALDTNPKSSAYGDVFVGDSSGGFHILQYDSSGKELASFAAKTVTGENGGLAFSNTTEELYASDSSAGIWIIPSPAPGPVIDSESATPELSGAATLEAQVNPEGNETTVHFEYVDDAHFNAGGYTNATSTPPVTVGSTPIFQDQLVSAHPTLVPGTVYHYRVVASNSQGTATGEDQSFQETPPALIAGPWASNVAATSVTIGAKINPQGTNTTYRLEYGTSPSYGHVFTGSVGEGKGDVLVSRHIQELEPVTTYHFRIVTNNEVGTWQSTDHEFTTQAASGELALPDGRAWELVSPADKHGAMIEPEGRGLVQAASDGHGIAYVVNEPITERPAGNFSLGDQVVSVRGVDGWSSREYGVSQKLSEKENEPHPPFIDNTLTDVFSSDLSQVAIEPGPGLREPLSPKATERTLYLYDNAKSMFLPLVTPVNVPPGTKFAGAVSEYRGTAQEMQFIAATPDMRHVVFQSPLVLTPEAIEGACGPPYEVCPQNLYEWSGGRLALVNIGPEGKPLQSDVGAFLGRKSTDIIHAISDDGRRIVWAEGDLYRQRSNTMYVRDMVDGKTVQFGGLQARFETASSDDSRVFYWESGELYVFDVATGKSSDVTANHGPGEGKAGVIDGFIMGAGEDGTTVYFAATGVLAPGAVRGDDNLYVSHYNGRGWATTLIATLSKTDEFFGERDPFSVIVFWERMGARISPNGRYIAFMSSRSLTGYDNRDALSGQADEEVYLYDAVSGRLVCASCNPSGARPIGMYVQFGGAGPLVDREEFWREHWIAANLPRWHTKQSTVPYPPAQYQPRYLSDSGRLFFNSSDALVSQDSNGLMDVYQYEPSGVGSCTGTSRTFNERSGGCVDLLSSGTSSQESAFMDASESGADVFFVTAEKLVSEDYDTAGDIYDAHECTASVPCRAAPVSPPPCTSGDSCKAAPSPQPEIFGPAPSATFSGTGNVIAEAKKSGVKRKSGKPKKHPKHKKHKRKRARKRATGQAMRRGK